MATIKDKNYCIINKCPFYIGHQCTDPNPECFKEESIEAQKTISHHYRDIELKKKETIQ